MSSNESTGLHSGNYEDMLENIGLDLFSKEPYDNSITSFGDIRNRLIHPLQSEGPFEFSIGGASFTPYTYLPATRLVGSVGIRLNGQPLTQAANTSVVNLFPHSLFKSIEVKLNNIPISHTRNYPYKAFYQTLFSHSPSSKNDILRSEFFYKDQPNDHDGENMEESFAYSERKDWATSTRWIQFSIPLHLDLFTCYRLLPGNVKLDIKLTRSPDSFSMITHDPGDPTIEFRDLTLITRCVYPKPSIVSNHQRTLSSGKNIILPITRSEIKTYQVQHGAYTIEIGRMFTGVLPRHVMTFIIDNDRINGHKSKSPYYSPVRHTKNASLVVNGESFPR